jgi:hypothetical protein
VYKLLAEPESTTKKLLGGSKQFKLESNDPYEILWYGAKPKLDLGGDPHIRGHLKVRKGELVLDVNSEKRATKLCKLVEKILDRNIEFLSEDMPPEIGHNSSIEPEEMPPEIFAMLREKMDTYYDKWIDESIPALNGLTPRQAAKDPKMKYALEGLLLEFERRSENRAKKVVAPDVKILRAQLFRDSEN